MSHITTHILDATAGTPATGVEVILRTLNGDELDRSFTDEDGRTSIGLDVLEMGDYSLQFATGAYFAGRGVETFYPTVVLSFTVAERPHYHVPLLLSPFGYSTYRGS